MKRLRRLAALAILAWAPGAAVAQDARTDKQGQIHYILSQGTPESAALTRQACAAGDQPTLIARARRAGFGGMPDPSEICVASLTRLARDGSLDFLRDITSDQPKPALAFDSGFVAAYRKHEPVAATLPSMAALKPVAERCFAQSEPNTALCSSAGYIYGARTAQGETITAQ